MSGEGKVLLLTDILEMIEPELLLRLSPPAELGSMKNS